MEISWQVQLRCGGEQCFEDAIQLFTELLSSPVYETALDFIMTIQSSAVVVSNSGESASDLQHMPPSVVSDATATQAKHDSEVRHTEPNDVVEDQMPLPATAVIELERWNSPKRNRWRLLGTFTSMFG